MERSRLPPRCGPHRCRPGAWVGAGLMLAAATAAFGAGAAGAETAATGAMAALETVAVVVELPQGAPALSPETVAERLAAALREEPSAPRVVPSSPDRLILTVAVIRVGSSQLRGFWLPFSGDYAVGTVRLAVERPARLLAGGEPLPVLVWLEERPVGSAWAEAPATVLAALDLLAESFAAAWRRGRRQLTHERRPGDDEDRGAGGRPAPGRGARPQGAARFTPDPFACGRLAGGRVYRTGDLGRYRPDGAVEFAGRADDQVQVRGFRVELAAVEAVLAEHPAVAAAVVAVRRGPAGDYLAGYAVPAAGRELPGADELRSHLAQRLPEYMVPGVFVALEALPLTATAKVDRRALPPPPEPAAAEEVEEPATPMEALLAESWRELLKVERVGPGDDFFALGGHSLLATRVVSRLRTEIGVELPLRTLFERPRLRDLAEAVEDLLLADVAG